MNELVLALLCWWLCIYPPSLRVSKEKIEFNVMTSKLPMLESEKRD